ncbi:hypothetical protein FDB64_10735 [Clostridium botulinum]|nr:hypothetical protein [Clostridium botulinum]NFM02537.1 hypothetical protein [Clostridium botulinum]
MDISKFNEKLNRIDGNIYTIEEVVTPLEGIYEAELIHDNVELKTINVYTGPKLTGNKINTISFSTPSLTPWKTVIKIFSTEPQLYISYETTGDQAEAEDINNLQNAVNKTQESLNNEVNRATNAEKVLTDNLATEVTRAKNSEKTISDNVANEITRAKASEKVLTDNLNTEINRAKGSEKTISDNLSSEVNRAKVKENSIESNFNNYKTSNDSEIQGLKAKDIDLDNKKANLDYVNLELNKRYTKDQTFTREEVLKKIQDLIGTAPDTLDTFKEIADALGNDPNFATTIMNELSSKVDKVTGKSLSTNDYDNTEKSKLSDVNAKKHEHSNKSIIDKITQGLLDAWNSAYNHINDSIRHITSSERNLWNTVSDKANKTDIPSKLSQLTNDKKFITQDDIDTSQNHIHNNKSVLDKISQKTLDDINLSVDKVLKNKLTPIETDSTLTKLDNCIGEYVHNMQIKGRTLQNLWNNENVVSLKNDAMLIQTISTDDFRTNMLKDNIEYSIVNLSNKKTRADITTKNSNAYVKTLYIEPHSIQKFTISSQYISSFYGLISEGWTNTDSDKDIFKKACMILEGDYTNKEIPQYFEGIKSVGESEGNKISILTCGKNLWYGIYEKAYVGAENGRTYRNDDACRATIVKCKPNTNYIFSKQSESDRTTMACFDNFPVNNSVATKSVLSDKITTDANSKYLVVYVSTNREEPLIQIEEGTESTAYEEYKEDKTEILLPSPHCGLPSGTADVVDYDKNERTKNVAKLQLETITGWTVTATDVNTPNTIEFQYYYLDGVPDSSLICNNFNIYTADWLWNKDVEGIAYNKSKMIQLRINKAKLESLDDIGLKKWFQTNLTVLYHQLANPITEKLNIKDELQTFTDGYIQLNNAITPCTSLEYSTNLPSALSGVVEIQDKILDRVNILEKKKSITWDELEGV